MWAILHIRRAVLAFSMNRGGLRRKTTESLLRIGPSVVVVVPARGMAGGPLKVVIAGIVGDPRGVDECVRIPAGVRGGGVGVVGHTYQKS